MKTHIFVPCFIDQLFPQTAINMVTLLQQLGCEALYNPNQTCCGQPALNAGFWNESFAVAEKFTKDFYNKGFIVCPSASCVGFIRNYYKELLGSNTNEVALNQLITDVYELTEFIVKFCDISKIKSSFQGKAMYHDSCSALRECKIKEAPRKLLRQVPGLELIENPNTEVCCGFGGTFSTKFEPISVAMAEQKVEDALKLKVDYIISSDLSCLMHLEGYLQQKQIPIKTMHIVDVLI